MRIFMLILTFLFGTLACATQPEPATEPVIVNPVKGILVIRPIKIWRDDSPMYYVLLGSESRNQVVITKHEYDTNERMRDIIHRMVYIEKVPVFTIRLSLKEQGGT